LTIHFQAYGESSTTSFNNTGVELMNFHDRGYSGSHPLDLSVDGKSFLIQYGVYNSTANATRYFIALTDQDLQNVTKIPRPYSQQQIAIIRGSFSPFWKTGNESRGNTIYLLGIDHLLSSYDVNDRSFTPLKENVAWFNIMPDGKNIIYDTYNESNNLGNIEILSLDTLISKNVLKDNPYLYNFDLSPDGKEILYVKINGSPLTYYNLVTKQEHEIPSINIGYHTEIPRWTPDGSSVVYQEGGSSNGSAGGNLKITSLDGKTEFLVPDSVDNPGSFIVGHDGKSLIVSIDYPNGGYLSSKGKADMYKITYTTVIPEFPHALPVLIIGILSLIVFYRMKPNF
jgi:hypothetical protein